MEIFQFILDLFYMVICKTIMEERIDIWIKCNFKHGIYLWAYILLHLSDNIIIIACESN